MNEKIITESGNFIASADKWGVTGLSVFFTLIIIGVVFFFMWFIVKELKRSVDGNTEAIKDSGEISKEIVKTLSQHNEKANLTAQITDKISKTQDEIHSDVKEILRRTENGKF
ncbi:hypothetical protein [Campylobacter hominis]|uniref:Uncharacterized protein n=2 Tax=Campylobacter TaxID=194 RepID=A7I037_CAMHC|nr:hypothetical protein [Campylobacter hominis]ABS51658.1 hypothetical protein CHAB381_0275 [Campylobacter hominis ATCC BAA-381]UAK85268.1 hypothetical protein K8O82_05195 [Campylobacter hominis]SUW84434.1 Uncharacterised protein [Campylobacter hominis]